MQYIKQYDFDNFKCIADKCPNSCCEGWQIVIDEESLDRYLKAEGPMGDRLRRSIDFGESSFKQNGRRCAMLNENGLCDLQSDSGEAALCYTCHTYPRHVEEYEDIRELSLSLSCPEVARMTIERKKPLTFIESEVDEEDDFEDFDYLLFTKLVDAREILYEIAGDREANISNRMGAILELAREMQECIVEDRLFDLDEVLEAWSKNRKDRIENEPFKAETFSILYKLERLDESFTELLSEADIILKEKDKKLDSLVTNLNEDEAMAAEQILMSLLYTYFCGAVYDDEIYSKAALCVYSTSWILAIYKLLQSKYSLDEILYRYAREVEHSDLNLDMLEEYFEGKRK